MFDCTLTEVEVWADDASNFRTRWRFYNRMKERKVEWSGGDNRFWTKSGEGQKIVVQ